MRTFARLGILAALMALSAIQVTPADQTLVSAGSSWKYSANGSNLGTTWRGATYIDSTWPAGLAQLGYGDGDEATVVPFGGNTSNRYITTYFRRSFTVTNPASVAALTLRYVRDDGCVIYLNGVEVARSNMPAGTIGYTTLASSAIGGTDESAWQQSPVDPALLVPGANLIAVELHQSGASSTDISFDLELRSTSNQPAAPVVTLLSPADHDVSNTATVTFTATATGATGLANATLYVGGPPATVTFTGPIQVEDTEIRADQPATNNGGALSLNVDGQTPHAHTLVKFPTLVGTSSGQVPNTAIITSATLRLNCTNSGQTMRLYRLTEDWVEGQATWNERSLGNAWGSPGADGASSNAGVAVNGDCTSTGQRSLDITSFVQEWSNGLPNYGLVFTDSGTDGIDFDSSESLNSPSLTVVYRTNQEAIGSQSLSGTSAPISITTTLAVGQTYYWNILVTATDGQQSSAATAFELTVDTSSPNEPVLVSPSNGSGGVSTNPELAVAVSNPAGGALNVTFSARPVAEHEFTIVALPDTQHYSDAYPGIYTSQTQWIVNNKIPRNIVFVTHLGDIVQNYNDTSEWISANASMSLLDGVVPYAMGPGNHDVPTTLFNQYFPFTRYEGQPWYGGHYADKNDNNYELFSAGGIDFVIVHLVFCPPAGAVAWADSILKTYPNRTGIITTHAYLGASAERNTHVCGSTQFLWDGLAVPNPNLYFMLSGHVSAESRRIDSVNGHPVIQMLSDYQDRANGGEGWLRILRFVPAENKIYVQTYSPWLNRYETDADSEFTLDFAMSAGFSTIGTVTAASGATASITAPGLSPFTEYEWRATVTNEYGKSRTGPAWRFTTGPPSDNNPPVAGDQTVNTAEDTALAIALSATDLDGNALTYSVLSGPSRGALSGSGANRTYQPTANYNGADSFTFRVNDGFADSNTATVSIDVQATNDPPSATSNSYNVTSGSTLTVTAPGVLSNDSDVDGDALTASLVTGPSNGLLNLNPNGSFTFTPTAGYSGSDSFTYQANDGQSTSSATTVNLTIAAPTPIFTANFNSGQNSFTYADDTFRGTNQPSYASGTRVTSGGFTGGALRVQVGGVNSTTILGMSGGWRRTFTLSTPTSLVLSFRYSMNQGPDYESDEFSQVLASVDGVLYGTPPGDSVAQVAGNGNGGSAITTGWQLIQIPVGVLSAGTHTLVLGGYNNKKNGSTEITTILLDDVSVTPGP